MDNLAICLNSSGGFMKGKIYEAGHVWQGMISIQNDFEEEITVDTGDSDFMIIINPTDEMKEFLKDLKNIEMLLK